MNVAEWILVVMLSVALLIFLIAGVVLIIKLIRLAEEAKKIVETGQQIATKADDIVDNVKGMTSVGGIVKTFANRVVEDQERRYAEDMAREAAAAEAAKAERAAKRAEAAEKVAKTEQTNARHAAKTANDVVKKATPKK